MGLGSRSHTQYVEGEDLAAMIHEDSVAERIAVETYGEIVRYIGGSDPTTRRMLEDILAQEEEHADDMADSARAGRRLRAPGRLYCPATHTGM